MTSEVGVVELVFASVVFVTLGAMFVAALVADYKSKKMVLNAGTDVRPLPVKRCCEHCQCSRGEECAHCSGPVWGESEGPVLQPCGNAAQIHQ